MQPNFIFFPYQCSIILGCHLYVSKQRNNRCHLASAETILISIMSSIISEKHNKLDFEGINIAIPFHTKNTIRTGATNSGWWYILTQDMYIRILWGILESIYNFIT